MTAMNEDIRNAAEETAVVAEEAMQPAAAAEELSAAETATVGRGKKKREPINEYQQFETGVSPMMAIIGVAAVGLFAIIGILVMGLI